MKTAKICLTTLLLIVMSFGSAKEAIAQVESKAQHDARMQWWRDGRFGLFIHWGLYAIPAGEWNGKNEYGEWIRTSAQIPIDEYDKFVKQFNPVKFNADEWVGMAKDAGMKYIVITSKHHDGFSLFDSKHTDFDVMSTPFKRDIMKELSEACGRQGLTICWYHSIMDWHHPDYLPRREWEKNRPSGGADYDRYVVYMKNQLNELLTNYGKIGVLWFDGEWENTWNRARGRDLYGYVRGLQPSIIINNRVGAGRSGMEGFSEGEESAGDFGTPEQQIPATGLPNVDWETCMTMNDHWGYNSHDINWKSTEDLLRKLADIASKGGNFLLNVGPTAEGLFPPASIDRLKDIGRWMKINGESIYGTKASPFKDLDWGRCTQKYTGGVTRLYLHIFDYPANGKLVVPGVFNLPKESFLLADPGRKPLVVTRDEDALVIDLPASAVDTINSVVVLDLVGKIDVNNPPKIDAEFTEFVKKTDVEVTSERENIEIRYTLDGSVPTVSSPPVAGKSILIKETSVLSARCFRNDKPVSGVSQVKYSRVLPAKPISESSLVQGISYKYYEGDWDSLPDFAGLKIITEGELKAINLTPRKNNEHFGFEYAGYVQIPEEGVYKFFTESDDGSRLFIGGKMVVDNDGLHGSAEKNGAIALGKGLHPIKVTYFNKTGGMDLKVSLKGPGLKKQELTGPVLFRK